MDFNIVNYDSTPPTAEQKAAWTATERFANTSGLFRYWDVTDHTGTKVRLFAPTKDEREKEYVRLRESKGEGFTYAQRLFGLRAPMSESELRAFTASARYRDLNTATATFGFFNTYVVGQVTAHRKVNADLSFEMWVDAYARDVLPYANFYALAQSINHLLNLNDIEFAVNLAYARIFYQSGFGVKDELESFRAGRRVDRNFRFASPEEDLNDAIDFRGTNAAFQNKPASNFNHNRQDIFTSDRRRTGRTKAQFDTQLSNIRKQLNFQKRTGINVYYLNTADIAAGRFNPLTLATYARMCGIESEADAISYEVLGRGLDYDLFYTRP